MQRSSNPRLALEQRIVFDAALIATGAEVLNRNVDHADHVEQAPPVARFSAQDTRVEPAKQLAKQDGDSARDLCVPAVAPATAERSEIIFVDSAVQDIQPYLHGRTTEVIVLQAGRDGVEQIAQTLAGRTGIFAIHILSHGDAGQIRLGTGTLDTLSISGKYAVELATIKSALAPGADILVYGCDVAAGEQGRTFVNALAKATGAAIAASTDITGSADLGGNWTLEAHTATIEARGLQLGSWHGDLLYTNTGVTPNVWVFGGTAAAATATNTTDGVTTTVTLATITGTNFVTPTAQTLNNTNGVTFFNSAQLAGQNADFQTTFNGAATDSGTITFTFEGLAEFHKPVELTAA